MRPEHLRELRDKSLVTEEQYITLEPIVTGRIVSVFYELRTMLYLGVLLFTTGMGLLIYENIGDIGHLVSIAGLFILTGTCTVYAFRKAPPYTHGKAVPPSPYFDYIVLLGCLLFISALGYLQFQYELLNEALGETTLVTSVLFFYAAYRFDHAGVLSLAITALASFWSISLSPQKWYSNEFLDTANLQFTAIVFGACLSAGAMVLDRKKIKQHFTFTYLNFGIALYLAGALAGVFIDDGSFGLYMLALYAGCALAAYAAHLKKSFLFLLYAFVAGYIGTTYMLAQLLEDQVGFWFFYFFASCGGFVYFVIRFRNYFKRAE